MIEDGIEVIQTGVPIFPRLDVDVEVAYIRDQMRGSVQTPQEEVEEEVSSRKKFQLMIFLK